MTHMPGWLTTWNQIADYCGVHTDTVQRWHRNEGFPVYRLPGGTVVALPTVLDDWLVTSNKIRDKRQKGEQAENGPEKT